MVERNLGFEAEHHERALRDIPMTRHRIDHQAKRFGILTTEDIKYGMMTLFNTMLRDRNVLQSITNPRENFTKHNIINKQICIECIFIEFRKNPRK
jgi:hypothetical protein